MIRLLSFMAALLASLWVPTDSSGGEMHVSPPRVTLRSPDDSQQLLVTLTAQSERNVDLTRTVDYEVVDPRVARVSSDGLVRPRSEGQTEIVIGRADQQIRVPLEVIGIQTPPAVSFRQEIIPILTKAGCNSGGCHGKAEGQNGFKLSVFGFDPLADYEALVKQRRGGRILIAAPNHSLLLRKASGDIPHGGGVKIPRGGLHYQRIRRWIAEGARFTVADRGPSRRLVGIQVEPEKQVLAPGDSRQLRVTALHDDGLKRCVTIEAEYDSNANSIAAVDQRGLIRAGDVPGEAAVLVRYMGQVAVSRITLPRTDTRFRRPDEMNFVDHLVWNKLQQLGIQPSVMADDATFMRRVYLDTSGMLPTSDEARRFLTSTDAHKRSRLIDHLLERDEYADYWAMRWSDILRVDQAKITPQGAVAMTRWLRQQFRDNTPYDQFVRAIITARGNTLTEGPASLYQVLDKPEVVGRSVSQLFLGVRIECAQCHHHPFEKWSQKDYFAFAGFFTGLGRKGIATGGQKVVVQAGADLKHPRTGEIVPAAGLGARPADLSRYGDRREALADWMVSGDNPFFARAIANRIWAHYFGRGIVEPIDDMRATNPATNEPLLDALAQHLVELQFDLKAFTRTLLNSRVYQLSAQVNTSNALDQQSFSRATWKALPAEVLLDAICQATGVREQFNGWPSGYRAVQVWDNRLPSYFFRIFGRPQRVSVCECERGNEPSIAQALHLMNSPESTRKIRHRDGRARRLADSNLSPTEIVEELYLCTVSRFPSSQERALMLEAFNESEGDRRAATEDILWTLLNTKEFIYNH